MDPWVGPLPTIAFATKGGVVMLAEIKDLMTVADVWGHLTGRERKLKRYSEHLESVSAAGFAVVQMAEGLLAGLEGWGFYGPLAPLDPRMDESALWKTDLPNNGEGYAFKHLLRDGSRDDRERAFRHLDGLGKALSIEFPRVVRRHSMDLYEHHRQVGRLEADMLSVHQVLMEVLVSWIKCGFVDGGENDGIERLRFDLRHTWVNLFSARDRAKETVNLFKGYMGEIRMAALRV